MIPRGSIVRITSFEHASDIRWTVDYRPEVDRYQLTSVASGKTHEVERVLFHAWLRCKQLTREVPNK